MQLQMWLNRVAHKGRYALSHNIFRIIKYTFQIMHNTLQIPQNTDILNSLQILKSSHISKSSQHISKSSQHILKSSPHISKSSQHIHPRTPSVGREKGMVTQLLLLPSHYKIVYFRMGITAGFCTLKAQFIPPDFPFESARFDSVQRR